MASSLTMRRQSQHGRMRPRDLGLHAVEGVDEYLSGLQHPSCADFDATVFSVLTVGRELKERKWGQHK